MKKIVVIIVMLVICFSSNAQFKSPAFQNRLVNDNINLLNAEQKESLEQTLRDFEAKTSIEIVVVTLDDLKGLEPQEAATQIGTDWGVGKKELDNGITFLVVKYNQSALEKLFSSKKGDVFIATGYGIEGYLTDGQTGRLLDKHFVPYAKEGKFPEAIVETTNAIIKDLGEESWQQREELKAQQEAKRKEMWDKFWSIIGATLGIGAIATFFGFLFRWIRKQWRLRQEKEKLNTEFKKCNKSMLEAQDNFLKAYDAKKLVKAYYPDWAIRDFDEVSQKVQNKIQEGEEIQDEFKINIKKNIGKAKENVNQLENIQMIVEQWEDKIKNIERQISQYKKDAPQHVGNAEDGIKKLEEKIDLYKASGFFLSEFEKKGDSLKETLGLIKGLENKNQDREVCEKANDLILSIFTTIDAVSKVATLKEKNEERIKTLTSFLSGVETTKTNAESILETLKEYPRENWADIESSLKKVPNLKKEIEEGKDEAKKLNQMDIQKFDEAENFLSTASRKQGMIEQYCSSVQQKKEEIFEAKKAAKELIARIPSEMQTAQEVIKSSSDVSSNTEQLLQKAIAKFEEGKSECSKSSINWIVALSLLALALQKFGEAKRKAENEIEDAERQRRQKREDEERRRRNSYSSSSSSYGGHSSSGGFSTGGGSFGGGGAGRSF